MKLDDANAQKIIDHIRSKWGDKGQCSKCYNSSDYAFKKDQVRVFALMEYNEGGTLVIGGDQVQIPVVPIFCSFCGYVTLLNVNIINEAQKEKPKEETP